MYGEEVLPNIIAEKEDIGFISPYRKQADKATQMESNILSDTVHKYQGRGKDIIVFSTVLDNKASKRTFNFVDDKHMVNVAVSRAKKQFILVTGQNVFEENSIEVRDLIRYIKYNTLEESIINSKIVSIFDLLYKDYAVVLEELNKNIIYKYRYKSENIMYTKLLEILSESKYKDFEVAGQVLLDNIFIDKSDLTSDEVRYINNRASVDFLIYRKMDNAPIIAIEVDGFYYHENNEEQQRRDRLKDNVFKKKGILLRRFKTNGSEEERKIRMEFDKLLEFMLQYSRGMR